MSVQRTLKSQPTYSSDLSLQTDNLVFQDLALLLVGVQLGKSGLEIRDFDLSVRM